MVGYNIIMFLLLFISLAGIAGIVLSELGTPDNLVLPFYYQLASTGLAFLVAISVTATIVIGMNGLAKLQTAERSAGKRRASEVSENLSNNSYAHSCKNNHIAKSPDGL